MESSWQVMVVGLASGIGGAGAVVAAFVLAFQGLSKSVKSVCDAMEDLKKQVADKADQVEMDNKVKEINRALTCKLDSDDCAHCHQELLRDLERGSKQFQELYDLQKETTKALNVVGTSVQLMTQEVAGIKDTMGKVTRIELRRADSPA